MTTTTSPRLGRTARSLSNVLPCWLLALTAALAASACGSSPEVLPGRRPEVLANLGANVLLPSYRTLQERTNAFDTAIAAYAASGLVADRDSARAAFLALMETLMEVEMMTTGPLGSATLTPGGQDLFDEIYSWAVLPLSYCGVDRFLAGDSFQDVAALDTAALNIRGMGAIDYLLFVETTDNGCEALAEINTDGTWAALSADADALAQRRGQMARALSAQVKQRVDRLVSAWDGGFLLELQDPTRAGALYRTAQEGLNAMADALFVLDQVTKDMRLGHAAGVVDCATTTCPEALETLYAGDNKERILHNLIGFRLVYTGGTGLGFDDLLVDVGAAEFSVSMLADIDAAIAAVGQVDGTLAEALVNDLDDVRALYEAIQRLDTDLKTTFLGTLSLDPPNRAGADND
ncbi:MAG: imelysin family protein [Polyangiales bacterium]|nr:imelysin family protein [Myxococcales bacterium]MCB9662170.1 imelysin family protein [Sandaracinaceae bacterium]